MKLVGEGASKLVYQIDDGKVLKLFKNHVDTQSLRSVRLRAEKCFGDSIPKLYDFTNQEIIEEYCGRTLNSSQLSWGDRICYITFLIRARMKHYPIDINIRNFAKVNGELKYLDWDGTCSESFLSFLIGVVYFNLYEAVKILEWSSNFRKIQKFYRANILPAIKLL